jgi:hypothetical protein
VFKVEEGLLMLREAASLRSTAYSFLVNCAYIRSSSKSTAIAYFSLSFKVNSSLRSALSSLSGRVIFVNLA